MVSCGGHAPLRRGILLGTKRPLRWGLIAPDSQKSPKPWRQTTTSARHGRESAPAPMPTVAVWREVATRRLQLCALANGAQAQIRVMNAGLLRSLRMNMHITLAPLIALVAGILILVMPRLLNYIVAIYLIVIGLIGLFGGRFG